jgi:hypothetical protein
MLLLDAASGRLDLLSGSGAHLHAANCDRPVELTIREHFCRTLSFVNQSELSQRLLSYVNSLGKPREIIQSNDLMLNAKDIREPTLWQPSGERHLSTLEMWLATAGSMMAGARLDSFVTLA